MKLLYELGQQVVGSGPTKFSWQTRHGTYLALAGSNNSVCIYSRKGIEVATISLPGVCTSMDWDKDGDTLAIAQDYNGIVYLWNSHTHDTFKMDTGMKESLSLALWARHSTVLALGTSKGNLVLYNHRTRKKLPILGKHSKKITGGAWNDENVLVLTSEDRQVTVSDIDGNTIQQKELKFDIRMLKFSPDNNTVSAIAGNKGIHLFHIANITESLELMFQPHYGNITTQLWNSDDTIMVGFTKGFMIVVSRNKEEIGQEIFQSQNHKTSLVDIALSPVAPLIASMGHHQIKLHEKSDLRGLYAMIQIEEDKGHLSEVRWTDDGQLLTASILTGGVVVFLAQLPQLGVSNSTKLAYLASLQQVTVANNVDEELPRTIECPIEPAYIAVSSTYLAVGMNNRVWFTDISSENVSFMERSYLGIIADVKVSDTYAAVLSEGKVELHQVEAPPFGLPSDDLKECRTFPDDGLHDPITCLALTTDFLIYGTEGGTVIYFSLEDWEVVTSYRHDVGVSKLYPDPSATRLLLVDEKSDAYVYNPVNDVTIVVPQFNPSATGVLWDYWPLDKYVFISYDKDKATTYIYYRDTIEGPQCVLLSNTSLPYGNVPILLYNGEMSCLTLTGKINYTHLTSHTFPDEQDFNESTLKESFKKSLAINRLNYSWSLATAIDSHEYWVELADTALYHIDIELATRAYQQMSDVGVVLSLQELQDIDDRNLLVGYIMMFKGNHSKAQEMFLSSPDPHVALEMRCDLMQWEQAKELAKTLAPHKLPLISRQYGQQLESLGDYANALRNYEAAISDDPQLADNNRLCEGGIARTSLYTGDMRRGVKLAKASSSPELKEECGTILEELKLVNEAGVLYEECECWEKATTMFTRAKNWNKVGELLPKLSEAHKLYSQYGKAKESDGHYLEAARAYEKAQEYDSATRIYLDNLNQPEEASRVVQLSQSIEGAKMVARFFQKIGDYSSALQFLVLSHCNAEAFRMAETHGQMDLYGDIIGDAADIEDYLNVAQYYRRENNHFKAGTFFYKAKKYHEALDHFIMCPSSLYPEGDNIDMAITVVGASGQESLIQRLHSYLLGEIDGEAKEARFLFSMYMSLQRYSEASQTAILIAREDQSEGNYRNARDMLFHMYSELRQHNIKIPSEMKQSLLLLHSYIIVKTHVKLGQHDKAARLLIRVANNISKFPSHIVPILTSTVIECHRSGLKESAFSYAAMLMRPEYRHKLDQKWKKKIEGIVRKPDHSEVEEELQPCPHCSHMLPLTKLDCPHCKNNIPYCIVTGRHMVRDDWSACPHCHFPALYSEFTSLLQSTPQCPMCCQPLTTVDKVTDNIDTVLTNYNDI